MKYGFIYLWFDRKNKKYYLGRHWGNEVDGYICSSNSMREAYRRRPGDFKRRILKKIYSNVDDLIVEEQRWLNMIKPSECRNRYYNVTLKSTAPSHRGFRHSPETVEKIKQGNRGRKLTEEHKEKLRQAKLGTISNNKGKKLSDEVKARISKSKKGTIPWNKNKPGYKVKTKKGDSLHY